MLCVVQVVIGGFNLLGGYPRSYIMKLVEQRRDMPCLGADVDVVDAQAEEYVVGEVLASFVDQGFCHDSSLDVRLENAPQVFCRCCNLEVRGENNSTRTGDADM